MGTGKNRKDDLRNVLIKTGEYCKHLCIFVRYKSYEEITYYRPTSSRRSGGIVYDCSGPNQQLLKF